MIGRRSLVLAASFVTLPSVAAIEPELTNFRFGIIRPVSEGVFDFVSETRRIPKHLKATGFRFGVGFDNPKCSQIEWYEIIHLPGEAKSVTGTFQRSSAQNLRTRTFQDSRPSVVDDFWFDEGDPLGKHAMELHVDAVLRFRVDFQVVAAE